MIVGETTLSNWRKAIRVLIISAALTALMFCPASAEEDCAKSWDAYDLNGDGYLKGEEAKKFRDDMSIRGIRVGDTKDGSISATQCQKAYVNNYWE